MRYRKMLAATIANQETIVQNITRMRIATKEAEKTVTNFHKLLPAAYKTRSPEWLLYTRFDTLQSALQLKEITAKTIEHKDGFAHLGFSATVLLQEPDAYSRYINLLGEHEALVFPFVSINVITLETSTSATQQGLKLQIEGVIQTPEPQGQTAQ